jgi:hypothetical protein
MPKISPFQVAKHLLRPVAPKILTRSMTLKSWRLYRYHFGRLPNVIVPKTFNEKLQARKLIDRRPIFALWADKVAV